jgi:RNase P/RNase MRP subunit p29
MSDEGIQDDMIAGAIERLLAGEPVADVLAAYPGNASALRPLLESAQALRETPRPTPSPAARQLAMSRMLAQVGSERGRPEPAGVLAWLGTLRARPLAFQAMAVGGALVLFSGLGIGASAATGTTPEPVRTFFRLPDDSGRTVHLSGAVVSVTQDTLVIDTAGARSTVALAPATIVRRGSTHVAWSDLRTGEHVNVTANDRSGRVMATLVDAEALPAATPGASQEQSGGTPAIGPDDHDGGVETESPHEDATPEIEDHGGTDDGVRTAQAGSSATPEHHEGGDDNATPRAVSSPAATKTAEHEDDTTPVTTRTREPGDEHQTPEPEATEPPASSGSGATPGDN